MQYFIGIVPPLEYKEKILHFQKKWKSNKVVDLVEPHITIKAQGGLTPDRGWMNGLEQMCAEFSSFRIALREPHFFGEHVLYLSVDSPELYQLHNNIVQLIKPSEEQSKKYFEREDYIPHLTLGETYFGMDSNELHDMAKKARQLLSPYPAFLVNQVRVYQEIAPLKYSPFKDIELK
jgi:2'-5' RNA ligase